MRIETRGVEIEVADDGPVDGEPVLLIMGLGMQLIAWPDELVRDLVQRGFRVLRIDNRDAGLSSSFDHLGVPNILAAALRYTLRLAVHSPYSIADMAADCVGVLDALGIRRAHVCGASMGGMIAQQMAVRHPDRVASLTLVMTTSGARSLPQPAPRVRRLLMRRPPPDAQVQAVVAHITGLLHVIGSPQYRPDPQALHQRVEAAVRRAWRPHGTARQLLAVVADGDRSSLLHRISVPTHIVHGSHDPLVPVEAAHDLHRKIPGSSLDVIAGMGHDLPLALMPRLAAGIAENARRTPVASAGT
jgi:pimeloyl-ACP methyl ester carboxylesterase